MGWIGKQTRYEGLPLALRVFAGLDEQWPVGRDGLAVLTHTFDPSHVRADGMPESPYNLSLGDLDEAVHDGLRVARGLMMIVETFGGKRAYYGCVADEHRSEVWFRTVQPLFAEHDLQMEFDAGKAQSFYAAYRREFTW